MAIEINQILKNWTEQQIVQVLRLAAEDSSKVFLSAHAEQRAAERGIDRLQVMRVLKRGQLTEKPWLDANNDNYRLTVEGISAGSKIKVVAALQPEDPQCNSYIIVVTVIKG